MSLFLTDEQLAAAWRDPSKQVFLVCEESSLPFWKNALSLTPEQLDPVGQSDGRLVLETAGPVNSTGRKENEAGAGIEPANKGFADLCLTTWLPRHFTN